MSAHLDMKVNSVRTKRVNALQVFAEMVENVVRLLMDLLVAVQLVSLVDTANEQSMWVYLYLLSFLFVVSALCIVLMS